MLSLQKLKIFVTVVERGSFNKAADDLMMSQSGVSQHIRDLESSFGQDLFTRSPQGVEQTHAGELLYRYSEQMLRLADEVTHEMSQLGQSQQYRLDLGTTPGISVYLLPQWLRAFQNEYANLQVSLDAIKTRDVINGVLADRYDFGFLEGELRELHRPEIASRNLLNIGYHLMVGKDHEWAQRTSVTLDELANQPFINRQRDSRTRHWLEMTLAEQGIALTNAAELDSPGTVKYALLNNMGVGILPDYAVMREVERGEIHLLEIENITLSRPLKLVWRKNQMFNTSQQSFLEIIETIMTDA